MRLLLAALLLTALAGLTACGDDDEGTAAAGGLAGTPWTLIAGIDVPGWEAVAPSASFTDGRVAGFSGCNRYTGAYTAEGDTLTIEQVGTTQMACQGAAADVERDFVGALSRVAGWGIQDGELVLSDEGGDELLRFAAASLEGDWSATMTYQGNAVATLVAGSEITASFNDGELSGSAGCNTYTAAYTLDAGKLTIEAPVRTEMACDQPEGVMEQEDAYLSALTDVGTYTIEGDRLTLLRADGTIVAAFGPKL